MFERAESGYGERLPDSLVRRHHAHAHHQRGLRDPHPDVPA